MVARPDLRVGGNNISDGRARQLLVRRVQPGTSELAYHLKYRLVERQRSL